MSNSANTVLAELILDISSRRVKLTEEDIASLLFAFTLATAEEKNFVSSIQSIERALRVVDLHTLGWVTWAELELRRRI